MFSVCGKGDSLNAGTRLSSGNIVSTFKNDRSRRGDRSCRSAATRHRPPGSRPLSCRRFGCRPLDCLSEAARFPIVARSPDTGHEVRDYITVTKQRSRRRRHGGEGREGARVRGVECRGVHGEGKGGEEKEDGGGRREEEGGGEGRGGR